MYYFGTDTRSAGHYFWEITDKSMSCKYLTFPDPLHTGRTWEKYPFNPERLFEKNETKKGFVKFLRINGYSICAIVGSPIDKRGGCVSVFFTKEQLPEEAFKELLLSYEHSKQIIEKLNPIWGHVTKDQYPNPKTLSMIQKFRKKPVVIEAIQYTGNNDHELSEWSNGAIVASPVLEPSEANPTGAYTQIKTLEGTMTASVGDWIIKEPFPTDDRKFYPCKPDIFSSTYEEVKD